MKVAGHTMATPHLSLEAAIKLFEKLGLDGIEIICRDDYFCGVHPDISEAEAKRLASFIQSHHLEITCLTPYITELNSPNPEVLAEEIIKMRTCIQIAFWLGCPFIRTYGGSFFPEEGKESFEKKSEIFINTMKQLGSFAHDLGVCLVVENHFNTLTDTAKHTVDIVSKVHNPGVGILYDQANLGFIKAEPFDQAISLQSSYIRHVHAKDFVFKVADKSFQSREVTKTTASERIVHSRVIGDGIVPWREIVRSLKRIGYKGFYSLEYEYWRHPEDLPPPEIGMKIGNDRLKEYEREIARI